MNFVITTCNYFAYTLDLFQNFRDFIQCWVERAAVIVDDSAGPLNDNEQSAEAHSACFRVASGGSDIISMIHVSQTVLYIAYYQRDHPPTTRNPPSPNAMDGQSRRAGEIMEIQAT